MTITIEELRKVYAEGCALLPNLGYPHNGGLLAVARFVAERQRAVEPTEEMESEASVVDRNAGSREIYRAMSAVAPLVVPE